MSETAMTETATALQANMQAAAQAGYAKASAGLETTKAQMKLQMEKAMKKAEEVASFNQGTVEAMMQSSQIWTAGMQHLSKQFAATAQNSIDETMSTFKSFTGMRSLKDMMDLQTSFARAAMEKAMAEGGRLTDAGLKLAEEAMAPLTARVSLAVETFSKT